MAALSALNAAAWARRARPFPSPREMKVDEGSAVESMAFLSLGMRRIGADVGFIRLLQYYGTPEGEPEYAYLMPEDPHRHPEEHGPAAYPELLERSRRILELDPYFVHLALYSAGALAFNLERPAEAVALLEKALVRDPKNWRYHAYLAAIAYQKSGEPQRVAQSLLPVASDPDSPALIKQVTAFLLKRLGRIEEAARLYRLILETSADPGYRENAKRNLDIIGPPR